MEPKCVITPERKMANIKQPEVAILTELVRGWTKFWNVPARVSKSKLILLGHAEIRKYWWMAEIGRESIDNTKFDWKNPSQDTLEEFFNVPPGFCSVKYCQLRQISFSKNLIVRAINEARLMRPNSFSCWTESMSVLVNGNWENVSDGLRWAWTDRTGGVYFVFPEERQFISVLRIPLMFWTTWPSGNRKRYQGWTNVWTTPESRKQPLHETPTIANGQERDWKCSLWEGLLYRFTTSSGFREGHSAYIVNPMSVDGAWMWYCNQQNISSVGYTSTTSSIACQLSARCHKHEECTQRKYPSRYYCKHENVCAFSDPIDCLAHVNRPLALEIKSPTDNVAHIWKIPRDIIK